MSSDPTVSNPSRLRGDIASAYLVAGTRIISWLVVSALIFRRLGAESFAIFALIRGTIGLLNYVSLGLSPALIHFGAHRDNKSSSLQSYYSSAMAVIGAGALFGLLATSIYALNFARLLRVPQAEPMIPALVLLMGGGMLARLAGDAPGAILQVSHRISLDNLLIAAGDFLWTILSILAVLLPRPLAAIALAYLVSMLLPLAIRIAIAHRMTGGISLRLVRRDLMALLLSYGGMVVLAQLADYLYAPTDYILINRLLDPVSVAAYAPAVQIDAGLLLLVVAVSAALLPHAAHAHASGSGQLVRRYYVTGTLGSAGILLVCSVVVWLIAPLLLKLWLGQPLPQTVRILPLVLLNTIIGGSASIGRSILLAVGRAKPFAVAALIAGVVNVIASYCFVRFAHLGLEGIVLGTVVAVVGRCVIWMPWYVLRTIRLTPIAIPETMPFDAPID